MGIADRAVHSTHVAIVPPHTPALFWQNELALPQVHPLGQIMQIVLDDMLSSVQMDPLSTAHALLQPSPSTVLPSSQSSIPTLLPSPHTVEQNLALVLTPDTKEVPAYTALHVAWLVAGLVGLEVE